MSEREVDVKNFICEIVDMITEDKATMDTMKCHFDSCFQEGYDKALADVLKLEKFQFMDIGDHDKVKDCILVEHIQKLGGESRAFSTDDAVDDRKNLGNNEEGEKNARC